MNLSRLDRTFRLVLGLIMMTMGLAIQETFVWIVGAALLATGAVGACPFTALQHVLSGESPADYEVKPATNRRRKPALPEGRERPPRRAPS